MTKHPVDPELSATGTLALPGPSWILLGGLLGIVMLEGHQLPYIVCLLSLLYYSLLFDLQHMDNNDRLSLESAGVCGQQSLPLESQWRQNLLTMSARAFFWL